MQLLRVQVPNFRALQQVDITFEKDFFPRIFPLGSQNGGGKSTLLQLIFTLLHCSVSPDRIFLLQNLLHLFNTNPLSEKTVLAILDIWDGSQTISLKFLVRKYDDIFENFDKNAIPQSKKGNLKFSEGLKSQSVQDGIDKAKNNISQAETIAKQIIFFIKSMENEIDKKQFIINELTKLRKLGINYYYNEIAQEQLFIDKLQKDIQDFIERQNSSLQYYHELQEQMQEYSKLIQDYLASKNLLYVCNYSSQQNQLPEEQVLLCEIKNIAMDNARSFLEALAEKVFLAAPATQVFLFLDEKDRQLLLSRQSFDENNYLSRVNSVKSTLPGFFTYEFLGANLLIQSFLSARDRDFRNAIETGQYSNQYQTLLQDLNLLMVNKKINLSPDFYSVTFKLDKDGQEVELYPEDLSHGELKRLSIYTWLKHNEIKDAIVLMDEIEIALHPDWQYKIVSDLEQWEPSNQYILATHSYELCQALTPAHVKEIEPKLIKDKI